MLKSFYSIKYNKAGYLNLGLLKNLTFDELWKYAAQNTFESFMKFFFPQIAKHIDFSKKITFLDKELIRIFKSSVNKKLLREKRQVDLLAQVTLKNEDKKNLFIHIEIQGYKQEDFARRMFLYYCLLYPKLQKDLISACLFVVKDDISYEPNEYTYEFEDFKISFIYPAVNIYKLKERAIKYIKENEKKHIC